MRVKKRTASIIEGHVAQLLIENRYYTARELKKKVEKSLKGKYRFTDRTYLNIKRKLLADFSEDPKDTPWSIGACVRYDIPADVIPLLAQVKSHIKSDETLTVRTAQWIAKFSVMITDIDDLYYISLLYALHENICDLAHITFDTSKPDRMLPDAEKVKEAFVELLLSGGA